LSNKKIFINTVPHSGTHFLSSILENVGYKHAIYRNTLYLGPPYYRRGQKAGINWRTANLLSERFKFFEQKEVPVSVSAPVMITASTYEHLFKVVKPGSFIIGHVPYSETSDKIHQEKLDLTLTIIRDPRDMILSMLRHVKDRKTHHAHNYLFNVLDDDKARFFAIADGYNNKYGYLVGAESMLNSMLDWIKTDNNLSLKFEDIVGEQGGGSKENQLNSMRSLLNLINIDSTDENIKLIATDSFGKTSTFRKGYIHGWKDFLTESENIKFERRYSDLLKKSGYL